MKKFTFIVEYLGGTYISQVIAQDHLEAQEKWIDQMDNDNVLGPISDFKTQVLESLYIPPTPLEGLTNTWCSTATVGDGTLLIRFTETVL